MLGPLLKLSRTQLGSGMELEPNWDYLRYLQLIPTRQLSFRFTDPYIMRRWIVLALLAFSTAGVVVSDPFSVAQRDQPEAERRVLS